MKPIGPHRASKCTLHLSGREFGLLGVLLEGTPATDIGFPLVHPLNLSPGFPHVAQLGPLDGSSKQISSRPEKQSSARPPRLQASQWHPRVAKRSSDRSSARHPCPQMPQWHPRVAKGAPGRSSARRPCPQVLQRHPVLAKLTEAQITHIQHRTARNRLRHGTIAQKYLSGIPAWRSVLLTGLRHGTPAHRCLGDILAWRRIGRMSFFSFLCDSGRWRHLPDLRNHK